MQGPIPDSFLKPVASALRVSPEQEEKLVKKISAKVAKETVEIIHKAAEDFFSRAEETMANIEKVRKVEFKIPEKEDRVQISSPHPLLEKATQMFLVKPLYLCGEAGWGKTTLATQISKTLGRECLIQGRIEDETQLMGYVSPSTNEAIRTPLRMCMEEGKIFILDEVDKSSPIAMTTLNQLLTHNRLTFPDKEVYAHKDFGVIATGNEPLVGLKNGAYAASSVHDASFADRFVYLEVKEDECFERSIVPKEYTFWVEHVQKLRAKAKEIGAPIKITPRASIDGALLLSVGLDQGTVEQAVIWRGLSDDLINRIKQA